MADLNITISIPDGDIPDLIAAVNWTDPRTNENGDANPRDQAEAIAWLKGRAINAVQDLFVRYRRHQAEQAISVSAPSIT